LKTEEQLVSRERTVLVIPVLLVLGWTALRDVPAASRVRVIGPAQAIEVAVRYPSRNQLIVPDSNFLFGSVGSGAATLEIDGETVPVESNGAFLAWLPVPEPTRGDTAVYRLLAVEGADSVTVSYPVVRPPSAPPPGVATPWVAEVRQEHWYRDGDTVLLVTTGEAGADVHVEAGDVRVALRDLGVRRGRLHRYGGRVDLDRLHRAACRAGECRSGTTRLGGEQGEQLTVPVDTVRAAIVASLGGRETRSDAVLTLARFPDPAPRVRLLEAIDDENGQSGVVVGRPTPGGPYRWRFPAGTVATVVDVMGGGTGGGRLALDLGSGEVAWVLAEDVAPLSDDAPDGPARAFGGRVESAGRVVDFRLGMSRAVPAHVTVTGPRSLRLTVFDAFGEMSRLAHGSGTGVARMDWSQAPGPRLHVDLEFDWPIWGYRLTVETGEVDAYEGPDASDPGPPIDQSEGAILRLSVRRPPQIDADAPLSGIRIAVDPGHPGAGSYGPTGLYEGDANLGIARHLIALLEAAGADPVVIRSDRAAVGLYERTGRARAGDADVLVSIHNNALPDGIRPFDRAGTSTFYYHPHAAPLANAVQAGMLEHMGLEDRGVLWGDLAMVREPWMPAVLTEGAFVMIPAHETALRTDAFQRLYAQGVFEGIEAFLRSSVERP
jgi:N-acetylmuramoyl-L-alanine amidase